MLTLCAVESREAPLKLTAAEVALKGLMDKAWERAPLVDEARVEARKLLGHRSMEGGQLRASALIIVGWRSVDHGNLSQHQEGLSRLR